MILEVTRRAALVGLSAFLALPARAQPSPTGRPKAEAAEFASLEKPATFDLAPTSGSLKETVQKGQELTWRRKQGPTDAVFKLTNISVGLLRSETGGQLMATFACNITSLGHATSEEARLNVIIRTKAGAALHASVFGIPVKCADKNQTLPPKNQEIPKDIAANVFANAGSIEITEYVESNAPGAKIQRCSS